MPRSQYIFDEFSTLLTPLFGRITRSCGSKKSGGPLRDVLNLLFVVLLPA